VHKTKAAEIMSVQTHDKRMIKALAGETQDRPPFWFMRQAGRYLPEYRATRAEAGDFLSLCYNPELAVEVTLQPIRRYGMDAAILFSDILVIPDALGQPLAYKEGEGPQLEAIRRTAELDRLKTGGVVEHLQPVMETLKGLRRELPPETTLIGFAGAPWTVATYMVEGAGSRDFANTKNWAFTDEAGFARLIDILVTATTEYLLAQVEAGAEVIQIFDTWAGALSETEFKKWCIAPVKRIVDALRAVHPDLPIIGFPRGAGAGYISFAADTGVSAVSLDTSVPVEWARDNVQNNHGQTSCAVQGNLDPLLVVAGGEAMRTEARRILEVLGKGPFIFNLGHGFVPQTPPEHVAELSQIIRDFG
jgi:uroporphyrinogen decarboxylase